MSERKRMKEKKTMQKRICGYAVVFGILVLYYFWVRFTGLAIPCLFHLLTGLKCPGCGITRMFLAILQGDFRQAYLYNRGIFWITPLLVVDLAVALYTWIRYHKWESPVRQILLNLMLILMIAYGIGRNLPLW